MTGFMNFNDAGPQYEMGTVIPDGTLARVTLHIVDGPVPGPSQTDGAILHPSKTSDVLQLRTEFTVVAGPFTKRKFWPNFTISGGEQDDHGVSKGWNISKAQIRAIIESAFNFRPDDMSAVAQQRRQLNGFRALEGLEFAVKIGIEKGTGQYKDKNRLTAIITPDDKNYGLVMGTATMTPGGWTIQSQPAPAPVQGGVMAPVNNGGAAGGGAVPLAQKPAWLND